MRKRRYIAIVFDGLDKTTAAHNKAVRSFTALTKNRLWCIEEIDLFSDRINMSREYTKIIIINSSEISRHLAFYESKYNVERPPVFENLEQNLSFNRERVCCVRFAYTDENCQIPHLGKLHETAFCLPQATQQLLDWIGKDSVSKHCILNNYEKHYKDMEMAVEEMKELLRNNKEEAASVEEVNLSSQSTQSRTRNPKPATLNRKP